MNIGTHLQFSDEVDRIIVSQRVLRRTVAFTESPLTSSEFEARLCKFLYTQFCVQSEDQSPTVQKSPVSVLSEYIKALKQARNKRYLQEIVKACHEYVATTGATHYISGLQLGALRYNTYSLSEYIETLGTSAGPMGGPLTPGIVTDTNTKWVLDMLNFSHAVTKKGRGEDAEEGEAVVGFDIQPVHLLVQQVDLRVLLKKAVIQYTRSKKTASKSKLPFSLTHSSSSAHIMKSIVAIIE